MVAFLFPIPDYGAERQLIDPPITVHVTLPNLRWFTFKGVCAYIEAVVRRVTTPRLESLAIEFFKQLTFSVPRLLHIMNTTENLKFNNVKFEFSEEHVDVMVYPREETDIYALSITVKCWLLDWQVSSLAQISIRQTQVFSVVEHLSLEHEVHYLTSEEHNKVDRTDWHKLLRSFGNAKTLRVGDGLVRELSRCLQLDDGERRLELLPEIQELTYSASDDAFTSFTDARQNADRPVTVVRPSSPRSTKLCFFPPS